MKRLSSLSREGLAVRVTTEFSPAYAEAYKGRATLVIYTGEAILQSYPTAAEMRELAAELSAAADRVEA